MKARPGSPRDDGRREEDADPEAVRAGARFVLEEAVARIDALEREVVRLRRERDDMARLANTWKSTAEENARRGAPK